MRKWFLPEKLTGMAGYKNISMGKKNTPFKIGRDAETGKFIPVKEAESRPKTTVIEKIKRGK